MVPIGTEPMLPGPQLAAYGNQFGFSLGDNHKQAASASTANQGNQGKVFLKSF